jgi:hypothetical protein
MAPPPFVFGEGTSEIFTITQIAVVIIALFLMAISIIAYRNSNLKKIIYAVIAFGLFAFQHVLNYTDAQIADILPDDVRYTIFSIITLAIMGLFFLAVIKK